uniref:Uncharacterized protein n=1 Tax=Chrysemys picta bellii TaxID=8478 RepID=A0A8C3HCH6_CHRPI
CRKTTDICGPNATFAWVPSPSSVQETPARTVQSVPSCAADIDECQGLSPADCGPHANCTNAPGNYSCTCIDGYEPSSGKGNFTHASGDTCQAELSPDIDECRRNTTICEPHGTCINMPGSYMCKCSWGFGKSLKDPSKMCTGTTEAGNSPSMVIHPPCASSRAVCDTHTSFPLSDIDECRKTPDICSPNAACINTYGSYRCECRAGYIPSNRNTTLCQGGSCCWGHGGGTWGGWAGSGVTQAEVLPEGHQAGVFRGMGQGQGMGGSPSCSTAPLAPVCPWAPPPPFHPSPLSLAGFTLAGLLTYQGMSPLLDGAGRVEAPEWDEIGQTGKRAQEPGRPSYRVLSPVVSAFISDPNSQALGLSVSIRFSHPVPVKALCVYWKVVAESGSWSPDGCTAVHTNSTHTNCSCDHLSSFAVLMAPTTVTESYPLTIITYVGLTLSLPCLFLAILTFLLCRSIRNVSTSLHLQLCLCLFLADLLFLTQVTPTSSQVACAVIAGLLHYLFLACFSWMFLEGLFLFLTVRNLKVVNYTSASRFKKRFMYPFGYGFPALVVAISAAVNPDGYGTSEHCWLSPERGFRWSFLGPVCAIILINITFFALTLWILRNRLSSLNADVSTLRDHRLLTFKAIAQLIILGCTWSLGLLQVGPAATVMAYLFTIVNSLQGAFIFLVHCLLNRQVREEYRRWIKGFRMFSMKSQTYDLSMSAVPTTSTKTVRGPLLCSNTSL